MEIISLKVFQFNQVASVSLNYTCQIENEFIYSISISLRSKALICWATTTILSHMHLRKSIYITRVDGYNWFIGSIFDVAILFWILKYILRIHNLRQFGLGWMGAGPTLSTTAMCFVFFFFSFIFFIRGKGIIVW